MYHIDLCYRKWGDNNTLITFSLHVLPLIGINHLINLLSRTECLPRNQSWIKCLRLHLPVFILRFASFFASFLASFYAYMLRLHASLCFMLRKRNGDDGVWTADPWHRMNLLLTNKPTRPRCPLKLTIIYILIILFIHLWKYKIFI